MHYLEKELFELLKGDSETLHFLMAASLDGVWYWDLTDLNQEWMSERFWESLGVDPSTKKHLASEWQDLIHPDDLKAALANFKSHQEDPSFPYDQIVRYRHADGSTVYVRCRGLIIRDEEGNPIRMIGAHNDVTDLKVAEINLKDRNEELEQFIQFVSHDLRGPLRRASAFMSLFLDEYGHLLSIDEGGESKEYLEEVLKETRDLIEIADNLSDVSKALKYGFSLSQAEKLGS